VDTVERSGDGELEDWTLGRVERVVLGSVRRVCPVSWWTGVCFDVIVVGCHHDSRIEPDQAFSNDIEKGRRDLRLLQK